MKISNLNSLQVADIVDKLARGADKRKAFERKGQPPVLPSPAVKTAKTISTHRPVNAAGEVRIIGGLWKRTKLPVANHPGLRPTPDRVRETLFNWLGQDMGGLRCVDAFAGTGALGLEAASRGAQEVLLVESDAKLFAHLSATKAKLKADTVRLQRGDGIALLLAMAQGSIDVVFIDPPFEAPIFDKALQAAAHAVSTQGAVYLEAPKLWSDDDLLAFGLCVQRSGKAGMVHYHLLKRIY